MKAAISVSLGQEVAQQVAYFLPDQSIPRLKALPRTAPEPAQTPKMRRGYRVKRVTSPRSPQEQNARDEQIIRALMDAMRRHK